MQVYATQPVHVPEDEFGPNILLVSPPQFSCLLVCNLGPTVAV